jgi:hypothetical protein
MAEDSPQARYMTLTLDKEERETLEKARIRFEAIKGRRYTWPDFVLALAEEFTGRL